MEGKLPIWLALVSAFSTSAARTDRWSFTASQTNVFDTNIDRDETNKRSYGFILGLEARYRKPIARPEFELSYEIARHTFTNADRFNRTSHLLTSSARREFGNLRPELTYELSIGGSTEDRDVSDQHMLSPRLDYKLNSKDRLRLQTAYRIRRTPGLLPLEGGGQGGGDFRSSSPLRSDPAKDADNRYAALLLQHRLPRQQRIEVGYRYEINRARSPENHFIRWSYSAMYEAVFPRDKLTVEARYRPRKFTQRIVQGNELRLDRSWILTAAWTRDLGRGLEFGLDYKYESRRSNDPDKNFGEHTISLGLAYHF